MDISDREQAIFEKDDAPHAVPPEPQTGTSRQKSPTNFHSRREFLKLTAAFAAGLGGGYFLRELTAIVPTNAAIATETVEQATGLKSENVAVVDQLNLPTEYVLPVSFSDIGPQLLAAGAIDYDGFVQTYEQAGQPLTQEQLAILSTGSDQPVVINRDNAYFLLNFFWAAGLVNQNRILTEGTMMQYGGQEKIGSFASTGGWTIGAKPVTELYASTLLFDPTPAQQTHLEEVASAVYRPCCNNPTSFPDCNHGMAMLGLLELMASQGASVEEMFEAAKYVNAFWFPQQTMEIALGFQAANGQQFTQVDAREFTGPRFSSSNGFQAVHQWLVENDLLEQIPNSGNSCGV